MVPLQIRDLHESKPKPAISTEPRLSQQPPLEQALGSKIHRSRYNTTEGVGLSQDLCRSGHESGTFKEVGTNQRTLTNWMWISELRVSRPEAVTSTGTDLI